MKSKDLFWSIFNWLIILDMFMSLDVWFFWGFNRIAFSAFVSLYCLLFYTANQHFFKTTNNKLITSFILLFSAFCLGSDSKNIFGWLGVVLEFLPAFFVILLKEEKALQLFNFFKKVLFYILALSALGWVLHLMGVPLPHSPITFGQIDGNARYTYDNYYLFLDNLYDKTKVILPRFSSIFTEPGFLGCILSVILFSERFQFVQRKQNFVFLFSLILTFSLAGWVISILGLIYLRMKPSVKNAFTIIFVIVAFISLSNFSRVYKNGDNMLYRSIFERLEYDDSSGTITGYNRTRTYVIEYFNNQFVNSNKFWFGLGEKQFAVDLTGSVDWRAYLIRYGFISGLFVIFYYLWPFLSTKKDRYYLFGTSFIFLMIALQTTYGIFSCMYISLFAFSIKNVKYISFIENQKANESISRYLESRGRR